MASELQGSTIFGTHSHRKGFIEGEIMGNDVFRALEERLARDGSLDDGARQRLRDAVNAARGPPTPASAARFPWNGRICGPCG